LVLRCQKEESLQTRTTFACSKLGHIGDVVHHAHALVGEFLDCVGRVEGVGRLSYSACEGQQETGYEAGFFGVDGGELAAVVGGQAANVYVRDFFQLEPA
jgi:hypothetical protein